MHEPITQANRSLSITTSAGEDVLLLDTISGMEGVSRPFRFNLTLLADTQAGNDAKVKAHTLVGSSFVISIVLEDGKTRYINGLCESFRTEGQDDFYAYYSAVIVPWLSFLNLRANCRIFEKQTVPDIIASVVSDAGFSGQFSNKLTATYTSWDYCVQYRETDFAFISRLMEAEGISYYFEHTDQGHTMTLIDAASSFQPLPNQNKFSFAPATGLPDMSDTIRAWTSEERVHTGKWSARDYHHEMPSSSLEVTQPSTEVASAVQSFETYDYPGEYAKKFNDPESRLGDVSPEGTKIDEFRIEAEETLRVVNSGWSRCRTFVPGYQINVDGDPAAGSYLLTEVNLQAAQYPAYGNREADRDPYRNTFSCIDSSITYRPLALTRKPVIMGLQTGLVVDESSAGNSEEIWPDKFGRIRVRFNWDRDNKYSCWLRVIQPWAGNMWGQQWLPRTGDEVAISFLEGDPDCPVVVGSIYNATNMPIFALPDNKTQSGIQTHSSPKGGASNYNMLRFEDKKDSEEIYIQAEKDWNSLIKHDETRTVKNNRTTTIHVNDTRTVETGDDKLDVQQGKRTLTIMGNLSTTVQQGDISETAQQGNISTTASMGNISTTASMGNISTTANMGNISTQADLGNISITADVGSISITSNLAGVTISCGASSIQLTPASIMISAPMVLINS